ncbi:MAG: uncharacterized protein A8A55_1923 [Amphiamblys sp. WSBS2006]|nr:MAG: uncharacterized protein A8A55_1923 [Amphiamblys sp. WSBS2006]
MIDLAHESFAKHGDCFFLEEDGGVLIITDALLENEREEIQKKKQFLYEQRQKVLEVAKQRVLEVTKQKDLERHGMLEIKRDFSGAACIDCLEKKGFLFPLCKEAHYYNCLECLDEAVKDNNKFACSRCKEEGDRFWMGEYRKAVGENEEGGLRLSALVTRLQTPDSFSLTHDLPNEAVLLTDQTAVTLSNIAISEKLFFVLLEKTKITVTENLSITEHTDNGVCIRENSMAINSPLRLTITKESVSSLVPENIGRIPPNSIGCSLEEVVLHDTGFISIFPKLRINEDCEVEYLWLHTKRKEHVAEILQQDQTSFGRVKNISLSGYAACVITKMIIHEDFEVENLTLDASEKEHVSEILAQKQKIYVGRVKQIYITDYAVRISKNMQCVLS